MTFTCPFFSPEVMVELMRRVRGHFVMLLQSNMHVIQYNPGHKLSATLCCHSLPGEGGGLFFCLSHLFLCDF